MAISLEKNLVPYELRWIGTYHQGLTPQNLPVAARSIKDLTLATGFEAYKIDNVSSLNGIVIYDGHSIAYAYVNHSYSGYRSFLKRLIGSIGADYDVDHALAKNLARQLSYRYVLLSAIPKKVNRKHGLYEKIKPVLRNGVSGVCFADRRVFNKILSRKPKARQNKAELELGYFEDSTPPFGLALNQAGIWGMAFGLHLIDHNDLQTRLTKI